jgi:hypothetical protein
MLSATGFELINKMKQALSGFRLNKRRAVAEEEVFVDEKNPWQSSLQRLAKEHKFHFELIEQSDELSTAVNEIAQTQSKPRPIPHSPEPSQLNAKPRASDRTIQDMKSWWKHSLTPEESSTMVSELPGSRRMMKRWFE